MISEGWYRETMPLLKAGIEDKTLILPKDAGILSDFRSLRVMKGVARVPEQRTKDKTGGRHGDSAVACAMMLDARKELGNAIVCGCLWRSAENACRAYRLRREWVPDKIPEMRHILISELDTLSIALPWVEKDVRLGFHGEAGCHLFDPDSIRGKQKILKQLLDNLEAGL